MRLLAIPLILFAALAGLPSVAEEAPGLKVELEGDANSQKITSGAVTAQIVVEQIDDMATPVLVVTVDGREVVHAPGVAAGWDFPPASAVIVEMDRANPYPEVVMESFSGGAHCCTNVLIASSDLLSGRWHIIDGGDYDGGGGSVRDADGDGVAEIVERDNAFLYMFDCYACSAAPLRVMALDKGALRDVTREPRFQALHRDHLADMESWGHDQDIWKSNGFLAGWVATKSLLGEGREAWQVMEKSYDKGSEWGTEDCLKPQDDGICPENQIVRRTFPEALAKFLAENGYPL